MLFAFAAVYLLRAVRLGVVRETRHASASLSARRERSERLWQQAQQLAAAGQFQEAVRLLYLSGLYALDERALLHVETALTNREHAQLLVRLHLPLADSFTHVVEQYDRIRYGHAAVGPGYVSRPQRSRLTVEVRRARGAHPVSRIRSSMVLLGICVVALLIGALRLATERTPLPVGSSYSTQPDGAMGLYAWADSAGPGSGRLQDLALDSAPTTLIVLQPETQLDAAARDAFDGVASRGGTLVVAGDSFPWLLYVRNLGVTVEPVASRASSASSVDGLDLPVASRYRLRADNAQALLTGADGSIVVLRMPYKEGALVVIASPNLLTNDGLRDDATARFVFREIVAPSSGHVLSFDEVHHSFAPPGTGPIGINQLLFSTAPGRAVMYVALLVFAFVGLSGRRLGPALPAPSPAETPRTMYEHVQMLANLYRRASQLAAARAAFGRHYARRAGASPWGLARIEGARTESELIAAVTALDDGG